MKTRIKNVAVLDMRNATEERVEQIECIENAALIITSPTSSALVPKMRIRNVASIVEVPDRAEVLTVNGVHTLTISDDMPPLFLMINGVLEVSPETAPEAISRQVVGGYINGKIIASASQLAALMAKGVNVNGKSLGYPDGARLRVTKDPLTAAEALAQKGPIYLGSRVRIEDGAVETLDAAGIVLYGDSGAIISQSAAEMFYRIWSGSGKVLTIPEGYALMEGDQQFDGLTVRRLRGKRFVDGDIVLTDAVTADALAGLESLMLTGRLFAPEAALDRVLDVLEGDPELFPYTGTLMRISGKETLSADIGMLPERVAIVVDGVLSIAPEASPEALRMRISLLFVGGVVTMTAAQQAALRAVTVSEGHVEIADNDDNSDEDEDEEWANEDGSIVIGNSAYFVL